MLAQNFSLGDTDKSVNELQEFLKRFGYLSEFNLGTFDRTSVDALESYQKFNGLPVTGALDNATAEHMSIPRCGVPDNPSNLPTLNFVPNGQRWGKTNLTYRFNSFTADLTQANIENAIIQAFNLWSQVTPLTFIPINAGTPDILIHFVTGAPDAPFDGAGNVLARATWNYNPANNIISDSRINFDDSEQWTVTVPPLTTDIDLVDVATHEIGHCLGLDHSPVATAIMRATFQIGTSQRSLDQDDINGIQSIYGSGRVHANEVIGRGGWTGSIAVADGFVYLADAAGNLRKGEIDDNVNTTVIGNGGWNGSIAVADGFVYLADAAGNLRKGEIDDNVNTTVIGNGGWNGSIAVADGFVYLTTPDGNLLRGRL
jgi:Matrixin/Putative peptidoglycan binding domain